MKRKILLLVLASFAALLLAVIFPMSSPNTPYPIMMWNATLFGELTAVFEGLQSIKLVLEIISLGLGLILSIYGILVIAERIKRKRPSFYTYFDKS